MLRLVLLLLCASIALATDSEDCIIDLDCSECLPEFMPLVVWSAVDDASTVRVPAGGELRLSCSSKTTLAPFPVLRCQRGRLIAPDGRPRALLDLGCDEDPFQELPLQVPGCGEPHVGRGVRELYACLDLDRNLPLFARLPPASPPPRSSAAGMSLFGSLQQMFGARLAAETARVFADEERLQRRLRELLRQRAQLAADWDASELSSELSGQLAGQRLVAARLLPRAYFRGQEARAAAAACNTVAAWQSVSSGNWAAVQRGAAGLVRAARTRPGPLHVAAGTHGEGRLRARLAGGRVPVPRYLWTVLVSERRAALLLVLNDPFVAPSTVERAPCRALPCSRLPWLAVSKTAEAPLYGLLTCCYAADAFALPELPRDLLADLIPGDEGLLTHL